MLIGKSYHVRPFDLLKISVLGTLLDQPIDRSYLVEPSGKVALGPAYGRVLLQGLTSAEAEKAVGKHLQKILQSPHVQVTLAGRVTRWRSAALPKTPRRISPYDLLDIQVLVRAVDPETPIDGAFLVEGTGHVPLGPGYGRVRVSGLTFDDAEDAIEAHLGTTEVNARASVTLARRVVRYTWRDAVVPKAPVRITPGELLDIHVAGALQDQPIRGIYSLEPTGQVALGAGYGRVHLGGLTLEQAEAAIAEHLSKVLAHPEVSVTLAGWRADRDPEPGPFPAIPDLDGTSTDRASRADIGP